MMFVALTVAAAHWLGPPPPKEVRRVITIAPSLTETVIALGATDTLVGVSRFDEAPEVKEVPRVGGFVDPSIETVVSLKPQVVVVQKSPGNQKPVEKLASMGITVLALSLTSIADTNEAMLELGRVLGREAKARELVAQLEGVRAAERAKAPQARPRVLFVYGFTPLVVAGPGSFADELIGDCGATNVAVKAATSYPVWSREQLLAAPPEVVVDASDSREGIEGVRRLSTSSRWVTLENKALLHPGPSLAAALPGLCASLRPSH